MEMRAVAFLLCTVFLCTAFLGIGYAALSTTLAVSGSTSSPGRAPGVYITDVTPTTSVGVNVTGKSGTTLFTSVAGGRKRHPQYYRD